MVDTYVANLALHEQGNHIG